MALKSFLIIEEDILQDNLLTNVEKMIYAYIRGYWRTSALCESSNNTISKYLNITRDSVLKAIKRLHILGYIRIRYIKPKDEGLSKNTIRVIEKPITPEAEQLSMLFKSVVYGKK